MKFNTLLRKVVGTWQSDVVIILFACTLYAVICCLFLGGESSYFDEGFTSYLARFSPLEIAHYTALDVHPPLYYITLHYWQQLVGIDVFSLRAMSVLWGIVAIIFAFLMAKRIGGRRAAWSVLLFVILSPLFIRYSEAMRMYTMALAIIAAATYILILLYNPATRQRRILWLLYAILVSAGMWTNYFTAFVWLAHLAWVSSMAIAKPKKPLRRFIQRWWQAIGISVLFYLPWLPWLIMRFADVQSTGFWIKPISIDTLTSTVTTAIVYRSAALTTDWLAVLVSIYIGLSAYVIVQVHRQASVEMRVHLRLIFLCAVIPILGLILLSMPPLQSSYVYRYVICGIFMAAIISGICFALVRFSSHSVLKKTGLYCLSIIVLMSGVIAVKQAGNRSLDTGVKNMVAQAVERIHRQSEPGTPIVSRSPYTYYTASLYETKEHPVYYTFSQSLNKVGSTHMLYDHPEERGIKDLAKFADGHDKIWIIAEDEFSAAKPPTVGWQRSQSFILHDPVSSAATTYGSEYTKP